jgi:hypothetical protein
MYISSMILHDFRNSMALLDGCQASSVLPPGKISLEDEEEYEIRTE